MNIRAFTLLETLVAVSVLILALVGPFVIAQQSLKSAYYARDQVTAFYLAQEGVEFVRVIRDNNYLAGTPWLSGIDICVAVPCTVDFPNFTYATCPISGCPPLLLSATGKLYNHASGTATPFTREIRLIQGVNPDSMVVAVTVRWTSAGVSRVFTLKETLFDWL